MPQQPPITPAQEQEIRLYQSSFPYRLIYLAVKGEEWVVSAVPTMRIPNKLAREGWAVSIIRGGRG